MSRQPQKISVTLDVHRSHIWVIGIPQGKENEAKEISEFSSGG